MSFWFWFTGMPELAPKDGGANLVGYLIVGAHAMQVLLSADFMYHYFMCHGKRARPKRGIAPRWRSNVPIQQIGSEQYSDTVGGPAVAFQKPLI